jgi:TPR repeat protein
MHESERVPRAVVVWRPSPVWIIAVTLLVVVLACLLLFNVELPFVGPGFPSLPGFNFPSASTPPPNDGAGACPRPQGVIGLQPGFNDQERDIRALRRLGFRNDFFAQLELGRRYSAVRATDRNIEDPVEAAVWYAMALANPRGYAPSNREIHGFDGWRPVAQLDDCRQWERHAAYHALNRLLEHMSSEEEDKVRNRVIYIQSTLGADGFRTLGRLYDFRFGPFGEPADNPQALEALSRGPCGGPCLRMAATLFVRNDVDAFTYNYLATQTGDVSAYVMLKDFEHSTPERASFGGFAEAKAKRWVPPYEFYPPDAPASGVPHSDESHPRGDDAWDYALSRMPELPFVHVGRALYFLGITDFVPAAPSDLPPRAVQTLQADLGLPMDGVMNNLLAVRAVQYAAVNGSAQAQLVLAVMYVEGIGVPADYARAFYWFTQADRQGSPEAKFAMASFFARGVEGVADQDKAKAVVLRLGAAMAGFQPSVARLQAMLTQVTYQPRPPLE